MGEVVGLQFTAETGLLNACLQGFELALYGRWRPTASQPELLGLIKLLQSSIQIPFPPPRR